MSTRSAVGYYREQNPITGEKFGFIGTYVHYDGYQVHRDLYQRFGADVDAIKGWIDAGIAGGGYSNAVDSLPKAEQEYPVTLSDQGFDYFWLLDTETGNIECLAVRDYERGYLPPELLGYTPLPLVDEQIEES